jgi:hypothetical protein
VAAAPCDWVLSRAEGVRDGGRERRVRRKNVQPAAKVRAKRAENKNVVARFAKGTPYSIRLLLLGGGCLKVGADVTLSYCYTLTQKMLSCVFVRVRERVKYQSVQFLAVKV